MNSGYYFKKYFNFLAGNIVAFICFYSWKSLINFFEIKKSFRYL